MIELKPVSPYKDEVREVVLLGYVEYHKGRQYPWLGCHGSVVSYFATQSEAVQFARTGKS